MGGLESLLALVIAACWLLGCDSGRSPPLQKQAMATIPAPSCPIELPPKYELIPDVEVFGRYSFQKNVPFLADRFGTVGLRASRAQELEAQAAVLQSQLDYVQAADEMETAIGRRP